ncbi:MAG: putative LPS assembly protein LptD, partial [Acidobacteriota bacterium]
MNALTRHRIIFALFLLILVGHLFVITTTGQEPESTPSNNGSSHYLSQYAIDQAQSTDKEQPRTQRKQVRETIGKKAQGEENPASSNELSVAADEEHKDGNAYIATGYVVITYGTSKLQADKVIYDRITGDAVAEGNVIYDPDPQQRITAQRATLNIYNRKGTFYEATGFTDQTADGAVLNFIAERVEKTGADSYQLYGVSITACEQATPIWRFESEHAKLRVDKSVTARGSKFRVKNIPLFYLPIVQLPLGRSERKSGFLIPSTGSSTQKGRFFQNAYYQTLGRSADLLLRGDIYTERGIGIGSVFRVRTDELSNLKIGTFTVFDRIIGDNTATDARDEGGTLFFAKGVQYLPRGFLAAVDVDFTTSLAFRRAFASDIEQVFNPEKRSQLYITNNFSTSSGSYSFNLLAENKTDALFNTRVAFDDTDASNININTRHSPSLELVGYGQQITTLPLYLSFDATLEGLYRRDLIGNRTDFITPTLVQRFDTSPKLLLALPDIAGWIIRPEFGVRSTYYSSSLTPVAPIPGT